MQRHHLPILICLCSLLISGCNGSEQSPNIAPPIPSDKTHIDYFGFALIDADWDDPSDAQYKTNYLDEVSAFTNLADILVVNPSDSIVERITSMQQQGVKAMLHIYPLFFELIGEDAPSGSHYALRADYQSRWDEFVSHNDLSVQQQHIQVLYLGEEPFWNGIEFEELATAANHIKKSLNAPEIMIIAAAPSINDLKIPTSVDWVGFDHYFVKQPHSDQQYQSELDMLLSKFSTDSQRLVIVMDTHHIASVHADQAQIRLSDMLEVGQSYYQMAKSQAKTVAIIGYVWPSGFGHPDAIGARNMPVAIKEYYTQIGKEITQK